MKLSARAPARGGVTVEAVWIILLAGTVIAFLFLQTVLFPKLFFRVRFAALEPTGRGVRVIEEQDGRTIVYDGDLSVRKYLPQYLISERGGKKQLVCRVGEDGVVSPDHVCDLLAASGGVSLVGVMAVNNETGCVQPVAELAAAAHAAGAYFFSDCVQAASSCDLKELARHADALALSAHKVGGPKGVGALVVKKGVPIAPLIAGGEQERGLRGGTSNVAGAVGFARALSLAQAEREAYIRHTGSLRDAFEQRILAELGSEVRADGARRVPNISHLTFARGGTAFLNVLDLAGVACSGGAACSSHSAQPSHVLMAMGRSAEEALRGVRFSFGRETTAEEAARAADIVIEKYRIFSRAQA